ncbi:hypothetical protein P5673_024529 [Acropora cervicornis]|uniref:Uncharacterized protein n=1 Tax=Acropora cervicornis TaxID=6130 RepID=A0AAD9Q3N8_ACRCE|nr:hypothetical protein P5673_024529 [Acropora cervicornis]
METYECLDPKDLNQAIPRIPTVQWANPVNDRNRTPLRKVKKYTWHYLSSTLVAGLKCSPTQLLMSPMLKDKIPVTSELLARKVPENASWALKAR